ncbi:MAG TPA: alpha/beta fold hydrolase [Marmoricola sp.]|nr:alpha/beta fold hydrolase [Marmoricola sp.]
MTVLAHDRGGPSGTPTVLLLHAGVADRRMWEPQWPALTAEHDVVRVDLRGFGESTVRPDGALDPVADVVATLRALEVERVHVVGCSLGAGVAAELAVAHPTLVASLVLVTPGGALIPEATEQLRTFGRAEDAAVEADDLDAAVQANVDWWVDGPHRDADPERAAVRSEVAQMQRRAFEVTADWDDVAEAELDPPVLERLAELVVPTLVLAGGLDLDAIGLAVQAVVDGVPDVRLETWPDVAHLPSLERPDDFAELVLDWLRSQPR